MSNHDAEQLAHLNGILQALRGINQLIVRERDVPVLMRKTCEILVEKEGFHSAWITLGEQSSHPGYFTQTGFRRHVATFKRYLKQENALHCLKRASEERGVVSIHHTIKACGKCPLKGEYGTNGALSVGIQHEGRHFGFLTVAVDQAFVDSHEDHRLLDEMAGDLAFALFSIEVERKREAAEQSREQEHQLLKAIIDAPSDVLVFSLDRDYRYTVFNTSHQEEMRTVYGVEIETGVNMLEYIDVPEVQKKAKMSFDRALSGEYFDETEKQPGAGTWYEFHWGPVRSNRGEIVGLCVFALDVTDEKNLEQQVRESENRYRTLFEHSPVALWQGDYRALNTYLQELLVSGVTTETLGAYFEEHPDVLRECVRRVRVVDLNRAALNLYQADNQKELAGTLDTLFAESFSSVFLAEVTAIAAGGEPVDSEAQIRTLKGELRDVYLRLSVLEGAEDDYLILVAMMDMSDIKNSEEDLRKLFRAVEQSSSSVIITNVDGIIEYVNPAFARATGYDTREAIGQNPRILKSRETDPHVFVELWKTVTSGRVWTGLFVNMKKSGELFWMEATISPVFDSEKRITHFVGIQEDITEKRQLEEQLRQSRKMEAIGQLAGGVAHDFNNLLTVINGYSEGILTTVERENPIAEQVRQIRQAGERAASLTRQLLAFSRRQIMQPRSLNANRLIRDMETMLRRLIGEDIDFIAVYDRSLHTIIADPGQIEQVVLNLAINARDAMPDGGKLTIETMNEQVTDEYVTTHPGAATGKFIVIAVSDTGVGIEKECQERIFEPFYTTKRKGKGTGLGLSTVYGIVKQSGGNVWVYSEPDIGTTFKVYLPQTDEEESAAPGKGFLGKTVSGSETILVTEDEEQVRNLIGTGLSECGYQVLLAGNREEALAVAREHNGRIDLLLTDVVMPGGSGGELAEEIAGSNPDTRTIFMSGYADESIVRNGMLPENINFIQKPFTVEALAAKIREVLQ